MRLATPFLLALCVLVSIPWLSGCGDSDPRATISGMVTLDGEGMPAGEIVMVPADPAFPSEAAVIQDGAYTLRAAPGPKQVVIRWEREHPTKTMPGPDPGTTMPLKEQIVPARYNDKSELTADVADGVNQFDFTLTSK